MARREATNETGLTLVGWQGVTVEIPDDWNIGAISGDAAAGYVRYDDDRMPRLEIKWASGSGFVDLTKVIDKYLSDVQKRKDKGAPEVKIDRDVKLVSKTRRKKAGLKCFAWEAEARGYGAGWVCKDCGRTMVAQVTSAPEDDPEAAQELAANVLLSIEDHPRDAWMLWSAYGFSVRVPTAFKLSGQRLMAGLIEMEFEKETEKLKVARYGMADVALHKSDVQGWVGKEMAKTMRYHRAVPEKTTINGHEGLTITGGQLNIFQGIQSFMRHCRGMLYADRLIGRAWHCDTTNKLYYIETIIDRSNAGLADELAERIECCDVREKEA